MQELQPTKAKKITIPTKIKRYQVACYTKFDGWKPHGYSFFTTPESALADFLRCYQGIDPDKPLFYTIVEIDLEIPVV